MAIFFGIDSNYASTLFSSLNGGNKTNSFSSLTGLLSEYSSIQSGSYRKLLNAYYSGSDNESVNSIASNSISTAGDNAKKLTSIKEASTDLSDTVQELTKSGSNSVFNKVSKENSDGTVTREYDTDAIFNAVKGFVDDYNSLIEATEDSNTKSIASNMRSIITATSTNDDLLKELGIKINADYTLSIDEDTFKKADMSVARSMFNGTGSYAYQIGVKASLININAASEASRSNTYTAGGTYSYNYNSGSLYNTYF